MIGAIWVLIAGIYIGCANSGLLEWWSSSPRENYYNSLVAGFQAGQLNVKRAPPPEIAGLASPFDPKADPNQTSLLHNIGWIRSHDLHDLSYYHGKLYLYFGATPALVLFWPYSLLTRHFLLHRDAAAIFFLARYLVSAGLLWLAWRRYFSEVSAWVVVACMLALGLADFTPAIMQNADAYEVAISCGSAFAMAALAAIWVALHRAEQRGRWVAAASLAYGLAVGARPSLLPGAVILLIPCVAAELSKVGTNRRAVRQRASALDCGDVSPLSLRRDVSRCPFPFSISAFQRFPHSACRLLAALGPICLIGIALLAYNYLRFDNFFEFGQRYQIPYSKHLQFSPKYLWQNIQVCFLTPAHWHAQFPFVEVEDHPFALLTNVPLDWFALGAMLLWGRGAKAPSNLRWFLAAMVLFFGVNAATLLFHDSMVLRYGVEYAHPLLWLAAIGVFAVEQRVIGHRWLRRAARCAWVALLAFSLAVNLLGAFVIRAYAEYQLGASLLDVGRGSEAWVHFRNAVAIQAPGPIMEYNLGCALLRVGNWEKALPRFQMAVDVRPDFPEAQNNLGTILLQLGRREEAIVHFQKAVDARPGYSEAHYNLATALGLTGHLSQSIAQFRKVLELRPNDMDAANNLAWALATSPDSSLRNGGEALALAQRADRLSGGANAAMLRTLAAAYAETGRFSEASMTAGRALQIAQTQSDRTMADLIRAGMARYEAGRPFRDNSLTNAAKP